MLQIPRFDLPVGGILYECENAEVEDFHLCVEDHGLFNVMVSFKGPGWGQGLPARALDEYDATLKKRVGTAFGCDFIMECVRVLGSPEKAKGKRVVVFREKAKGYNAFIVGFAALNADGSLGDPFLPDVLAEKHYPNVAADA